LLFRLNVVAGPNGTGKSTILNAICLGLGGDPKVLGRAEDVRDFVMHGEDVGEIDIALTPHPGNDDEVEEDRIRRVIDRRRGTEKGKGRGSSTFYLNGESVHAKQIQELVRDKYAIAIENLCTFLPQDKVGGFSALTPQELLLETEKVLDKDGFFIRAHLELMEDEGTIQSGESDVEALKSKLKKLTHENKQLEQAKDLLERRGRVLVQLGLLKKKQLWLQFEALRVRAVELKEQSTALREQLKALQKELEPLQVQAEALESQVKQVEAKSKSLQDKTKAAVKDSEKFQAKFQTHEERVDEAVLELNALDDKRAQQEELVRQRQEKVDSYEEQRKDLPPREELEGERDAAVANRRETNRDFSEAKQRLRQLRARYEELDERASKSQRKVGQLSDSSARRRQEVFRRFNYLAKAQAWLDNNRDKFRRPVVGPIAAEINPESAEVASYIEQHVQKSTLKTYCVETIEDRDMLYNEVRVRMNIPINIIVLRREPRRPRLYSNDTMRELQRYGVEGFLDEMFTAPDIVMQALIEGSLIDRVLFGNRKAYENMHIIKNIVSQPETGGGNLRAFAVCCPSPDGRLFKFQGNKSRYANQISVRQDDVEPSQFLFPGTDPAALTAAKAELDQAHEEINDLRPQLTDAEANAREKEAAHQESMAASEVAKKRLESLMKIEERYQNALRKLKEAQDAASANDAQEKKALAEAIMSRLCHAISALEGRSQQASVIVRTTAEALGATANKTCLTTSLRLVEYVPI
jgi:chromosome segregation ATPase